MLDELVTGHSSSTFVRNDCVPPEVPTPKGQTEKDNVVSAKTVNSSVGTDIPKSAMLTGTGATLNCGGGQTVLELVKEIMRCDPNAECVRNYCKMPWFHCADDKFIQAVYSYIVSSRS